MTGWEPATEVEAAMWDALRASDQDLYFRLLARTDLLLPVAGQAGAGRTAAAGWGTWTTSGRTHVLAFTSEAALRACLAENAGATRRTPYTELAGNWPNVEWWLAVNPGLPIEGYLPAWFVAQLVRGDVRLPGRTLGARARLERLESTARARATAAVPGRTVAPGTEPHRPSDSANQVLPGSAAPHAGKPPVPRAPVSAPPSALVSAPPLSATDSAPPSAPVSTPPWASDPVPPPAHLVTPSPAPPPVVIPGALPNRPTRSPQEAPPFLTDGALAESPATLATGGQRSDPPPLVTHTSTASPMPTAPTLPPNPEPAPVSPAVDLFTPAAERARRGAAARTVPSPPQFGPGGAPEGAPATPVSSVASTSGVPAAHLSDLGTLSGAGLAAAGADARPDPAPATGPDGSLFDADRSIAESGDLNGYRTAPAGRSSAEYAAHPVPAAEGFVPANEVERNLLDAAADGSTDTFLSTLLLAKVLLPVPATSMGGAQPGEEGYSWYTERIDGGTHVVAFTSPERMAEHIPASKPTVTVKFARMIRRWPDKDWSFAINPGTPVGAKLPGTQIIALANWAAEVGLGEDEAIDPKPVAAAEQPVPRPAYTPARSDPGQPTVMQKAIAPSQVGYYLERGYDRVSGFVHRQTEVAHLNTPARLYAALGLNFPGTPFTADAREVYLLRWPAYRPGLYRIPYGGQNEAAMRAMEGWVIERPPFRGNGFAPGESSDVVAEFKVDSVRLPHGAQLWRIEADGTETMVATLDCDEAGWKRVEEK